MKQPVTNSPRQNATRAMRLTLAFIALSVLGSLFYGWWKWKRFLDEWNRVGPIEASGGIFFQPRLEIKVPHFRQADERWGKDLLGDTPATLAAEGCAVASAAMVLASYGIETDPGHLNRLVRDGAGYVGTGWLDWDKAADVTGNIARKVYEDAPSFRLIDDNLARRNPVIVRLRTKADVTHFVVIAGKEGYDYLALDPGVPEDRRYYPLKEFGSKIEALRFYEKVPPGGAAPASAQR